MAPSSPAQGGERHLQAHVPSALPVPCLGTSHLDGDCGWPWGPVTSGWEEVKSKSGTPWIRTFKGDQKGEAEAPQDIQLELNG